MSNLTHVISDKLIMFGDQAPHEVIRHVFAEYTGAGGGKSQILSDSEQSIHDRMLVAQDPVKLLTLVAMYSIAKLDSNYKPIADNLLDFEEYSKTLFDIHPVARLYYWVKYILKGCNCHLSKQEDDQILITLRRLNVINQDRFPIILNVSTGSCSLVSSLAVLTDGDLMDPKWLAETIKSGKQVNWDAIRDEWKTVSYLDPFGLQSLIGVIGHQPGNLVKALPARIVFRILTETPHSSALRELIIKEMSIVELKNDCKSPESAFMVSVWATVKCQSIADWNENPTKILHECLSREHVATTICRAYGFATRSGDELTCAAAITMKWVSSFISPGEFVANGLSATKSLLRMLSTITNKFYESDSTRSQKTVGLLGSIWSGSFACCIPISSKICFESLDTVEDLGRNGALSLKVVCSLIGHIKTTLPPEWPQQMRHIKSVLAHASTSESLQCVADFIENSPDEAPPELILAFVASPFAPEHLNLLRKIFNTSLTVDTFNAEKCLDQLKKNIEKAAVGIFNINDIKISGTLGSEVITQWKELHRGDAEDVSTL